MNRKIKNVNIINIPECKDYIYKNLNDFNNFNDIIETITGENIVINIIIKESRKEYLIKEIKNYGYQYYENNLLYCKFLKDENMKIEDLFERIIELKNIYKNTNYYKNYIYIKSRYKISHKQNYYYSVLFSNNSNININILNDINLTIIHDKLDSLFELRNDNNKCKINCNNQPAILCGYCKHCCCHDFCIRH
jgi:hypothetical protein